MQGGDEGAGIGVRNLDSALGLQEFMKAWSELMPATLLFWRKSSTARTWWCCLWRWNRRWKAGASSDNNKSQ